ncbi:MAG: anaerobic ribonucleoside-triphosphate reductase activating protein [Candidatus Mcinerneyibacterium aminivorans]|uniref:Anaerobic ribonucleoside-triphosphate reductase activating protein n=1 Tax=Candidatus Mcinerneyibacterium aminivorans TaxID=2703815 RepID=A0A5D0MJY6_9BACT|nr:MAG: anaerobic ribonucleoside-triphosphate reductase activating protein [Candidatus Mcinerneyibacterium aminivorans]
MIGMVDLKETTLIDFPGKIAATVFTQGCNFNCAYCHNKMLIGQNIEDVIDLDSFREFIQKRKNFLEGIVFTGGEPLLYNDLGKVFKIIKSEGLDVKLDTNGSQPKKLKDLLDKDLIDYVAMDVKSDYKNYESVIGREFDLSKIENSIKIISSSNIDYEFRTTVIPEVTTIKTVKTILEDILPEDVKKYALQRYQTVEGYIQIEHTKEDWQEYIDEFGKYDFVEFRGNF